MALNVMAIQSKEEIRDFDNTKTRILIVDDHPLVREGAVQQINRELDWIVCGQAGNAREALEAIRDQQPDLVLLDLALPGKGGLELLKDIKVFHPHVRVLVLSMHDESLYAERVIRAGARGYLMKSKGGTNLVTAIRKVLAGQVYLSAEISTRMLERLTAGKPAERPPETALLTDRELEVFRGVGLGKTTGQIAQELSMSAKTVEAHRLSIKRKLKVRTGPELTRRAVIWVESIGH